MEATKQQKMYILRYLLMQVEQPNNPYTKVPKIHDGALFFIAPAYEHVNYDRFRACDFEGNEEFCETIIELWDKFTKLL